VLREATGDNAGLAEGDRRWTRLDDLSLHAGGRSAVPFTETLPANTTAVRLRPDGDGCNTTIAWGDLTTS
jgi:hypothetical protein